MEIYYLLLASIGFCFVILVIALFALILIGVSGRNKNNPSDRNNSGAGNNSNVFSSNDHDDGYRGWSSIEERDEYYRRRGINDEDEDKDDDEPKRDWVDDLLGRR